MTNRENYSGFNALQLDGNSETVGSTSVRVYTRDSDDNVLICSGTSVPSTDEDGYSKGCLFIKTDAADGTKGLYENQGTSSDCDFNLIGDISSAEIADDAITSAKIASGAVDGEALGMQKVILQGDAVLDLTDDSTPSQATIASSGDITATRGGDTLIPVRIWAYVTTEVAADSTAPIITVEDSDGTDAGLALTLTDGDAAGDIATAAVSDGDAMTAVDLTAKDLVVTVTTAAADAGTAAGECKVIVECLLVK